MPDPKKYDSEKNWMSACVPRRIEEGDKRDQAVAVCLNMWRNKERGEGQGVGGERQGDGGAEMCVCPECGKEVEHERGEPCADKKCPECGGAMAGKDKAMEDYMKDGVWNALKEFFTKEKPMKTVGGVKYPSSDFLVVEDSSSPNTWHLQVKKHGTPDHNLMGAAKAALTSPGGHRGNQYQGPNKQQAIAKLKRLYASEDMEWTKEINHPFIIYKDTETNEYRWLAVYSNKWRDDDNPPEILASKAHQDFVNAVDKGDWPMPELWLWHIPGSRFGVADFVAYDDSGFSLAAGSADKDKEYVAEALSQYGDLAMSHGMPIKEIERDTEDPTIITRYRSIEVSPLPREKAANKYGTGFEILTEVKMAIPEEKRPELEKMLGGADGLAQFEAGLAEKAKELDGLEIESKDSDEAAEEAEQVAQPVEEVGDEQEAEPKEESAPVEEPPQYVTAQEVAEAVGAYLKPLMDQVSALVEENKELRNELKEMKKSGDERLKEELANTPAASLFERIRSAVGADETYVDGRTKLAKEGPKENHEGPNSGPTSVGIINELMAQAWGQQ